MVELQNFVFEIGLSESVRYMCAAFILASCEADQDVGIPNGHRRRPHPIRKIPQTLVCKIPDAPKLRSIDGHNDTAV